MSDSKLAAGGRSINQPSHTPGRHSRNTAEPALPGRWCCPLEGGWRSDTKCAKPGGESRTWRDVFPGAVLDLDHDARALVKAQVIVGGHVEHTVRARQFLHLL